MKKLLLHIFLTSIFLLNNVFAQESDLTLKSPFETEEESKEKNIPSQIDLTKIPHFPHNLNKPATPGRISVNSSVIPLDLRLRLAVENFIDTKKSMSGDYFKAHVLEDFYIPADPPQLIVPKGSWIRGRISSLKKPNIIIMSGKIHLYLDELVTPIGEIVPLNAEIDVQKGFPGDQGLLNPITVNTGSNGKQHAQIYEGNALPLTIDSLDFKIIGSLVSGQLTALSSDFDSVVLNKGEELQVVIKKDIKLAAN